MLKTILFLSIIIKLAFGEEEDEELEVSTVEITMNTFDALTPYIELYNDEIEEEMVKTCRQITKRKACMNAVSRAPNGRVTKKNARGNDSPGECMWFQRRNHPIVLAVGNGKSRCLAPLAVINARKAIKAANPPPMVDEDEEDDDIDAIEMPEELFDALSANAPSNDVTEEMMKYCLEIKGERVCLNSVSRVAPGGKNTGRRGNDSPGECMWFEKKRNTVVQALGNRCLPPAQVINYKRFGTIPMVENEFFAALGLTNENNELNYNALSMVIVMMVLIGFGAYYKLCKNNKKKESILLNGRPSQYQSV